MPTHRQLQAAAALINSIHTPPCGKKEARLAHITRRIALIKFDTPFQLSPSSPRSRIHHMMSFPHIDPCNNKNEEGGETEHHHNITDEMSCHLFLCRLRRVVPNIIQLKNILLLLSVLGRVGTWMAFTRLFQLGCCWMLGCHGDDVVPIILILGFVDFGFGALRIRRAE